MRSLCRMYRLLRPGFIVCEYDSIAALGAKGAIWLIAFMRKGDRVIVQVFHCVRRIVQRSCGQHDRPTNITVHCKAIHNFLSIAIRPRNRSSRPLTIDLRQISINSIDRLDFWPFSRLSLTQRLGDRLDPLDRLYT